MSETFVKFVNHASFLICFSDTKILSDPWYNGTAFNDGWSLLSENNENDIKLLLQDLSYIFISHEHPDHLSIKFFKKYSKLLLERKTKVLFQKTRDNRVKKFLESLELEVIELDNRKWIDIEKNIRILLVRDGFIDSALIMEFPDCIVLNINDCDFSHYEFKLIEKSLPKNKKRIVLNQFSYAAWREDEIWLEKAAKFKLQNLKDSVNLLKADLLLPFASFIWFCNEDNQFLNKSVNDPARTSKFLTEEKIPHCFFKLGENQVSINNLLDKVERDKINKKAINFWQKLFKKTHEPITFITKRIHIEESDLSIFKERIKENNNFLLLCFIRILSFKFIFGDCLIKIAKSDEVYKLNIFGACRASNILKPDIEISSDSLKLVLTQPWGLDTLTVNGRLLELKTNGFRKLAFSIGFTTLNSANFGIKFIDILRPEILKKIVGLPIRILFKIT